MLQFSRQLIFFLFQALKGAPKGIVRIGVSKPLPVQDSSTTLSQEGGSGSTAGDDNTEVRSEMSDMEAVDNLPLSPSRNLVDEIPPPLPTRWDYCWFLLYLAGPRHFVIFDTKKN